MNFIIKKLILLFFIAVVPAIVNAANTPKDVVTSFGKALSAWCQSGDISYRIELERLCNGVKKCRVEDKIHADYQREFGFVDDDKTFVLDSYLNMFQTLMPEGIRFSMSNITVETQDHYPDGQVLTFITADISISGRLNNTVKDVFLVRDDKISGIYSYSSQLGFQHLNGSLIAELNRGKYVEADGLENRMIRVTKENGHMGIIDYKGNILVPPIWGVIVYCGGEFARGCNEVNWDKADEWYWSKYWGNGSLALGPIYDLRTGEQTPFSNVLGLGDPDMNKLFVNKIAIVQNSITNKWGYLRENDLTYSDIKYCIEGDAYYSAFFDDNGYAVIELDDKRTLIDRNYNIRLQDNSQYELLYMLDRNLIKIRSKSTGKYGAVNLNGDIVIPCKYDYMYNESEGLIRVVADDKYGFVNTNGRLVIPCIYDYSLYGVLYGTMINDLEDPHIFENGYCLVGNNTPPNIVDDTYPSFAVIDKKGNIVLPFNFSYNEWPWGYSMKYCSDIGYYTITKREDGKEAFISLEDGNLIKGFYWYENLFYEDNGFIRFSDNGTIGLLNTKGEVVIPTGSYEDIGLFNNGYAIVGRKINGKMKYGYINTDGVMVIPCIYDEVSFHFEDGIALVRKDGQVGLIDVFGNSTFLVGE